MKLTCTAANPKRDHRLKCIHRLTCRRSLVKDRSKQTCTRVSSTINWQSNDTMRLIRFFFCLLSAGSSPRGREQRGRKTTKGRESHCECVEINAKITRIWSVCNFFLIAAPAHVLARTPVSAHVPAYTQVSRDTEAYPDNINWYTSNAQRLLFVSACNQWVNYIMFHDLLRALVTAYFPTSRYVKAGPSLFNWTERRQ